MELRKPIFIVGTGRSGTTIFNQIFSEHPNLAWLSRLTSDFPTRLFLNRYFLKAIDYPLVGSILKKLIHPGEVYGFLDYYCKGFGTPCRDLFTEDVTNPTKEKFRNALSEMLTPKRNRLVVKITGWPRIGYLHEIFEDAKFIHVLRDGRSVVNSLLEQEWWWGWRGPENWRWGQLSPSYKEEWEKYNKSFVALAAIEWKILMDAFEKAERSLSSDNYLIIKYENLCSEPLKAIEKATQFCELEWTRTFENSIKKYTLRNANYKRKKDLTQKQQEILEMVLGGYLKKYDYC